MGCGKPLSGWTDEVDGADELLACEESKPVSPADGPICILNALPTRAGPATSVEESASDDCGGVSRGMSDRMQAIEALSTVEPSVVGPCDEPFAGESFAQLRQPRTSPARIGLLSALLSALLITAAHMALAADEQNQTTAKADAALQLGVATSKRTLR